MRNTYVSISRNILKNNADVIREICGEKVAVCAVIKADAYGHGIVEVAKAIKGHVDYFAVALVSEGELLRKNNIEIPILLLGAIDEDEIVDAIKNRLTITAASLEKLNLIAEKGAALGQRPIVHLKIDTGMNRIGVHWDRADKFITRAYELNKSEQIDCEGIYSHFSDSMNEEFTKIQFERFQNILTLAKQKGLTPKLTHICSSRSIFLYPEFHMTMVRPGIALYGTEPECDSPILPKEITPALTWKSRVVYFKVVKKDESVGYGRTYYPKAHQERIVTLPLGYADGYPRRLSNKGFVMIHNKKYPIVGRVCMDQIMVSLGADGEAYVGDEVTLIGQGITARDLANLIDTAPHEITTCISPRVPRIFID